jgi:hypothetical protein
MKLQSNTKQYPKFVNIGDTHEGALVSVQFDRPGTYGPETLIVLSHEEQELTVRCPSSLSRTLKDNQALLVPGSYVRLEYVRDVPTSKGNPAKIIDVDVEPLAEGFVAKTRTAPEPSDADDSIPF